MVGNTQLTAADPVLEQPRIDVDERAAFEAREQLRVNLLMKVEQQLRTLQKRLGLSLGESDVGRLETLGVLVIGRIQDRRAHDPEPRKRFGEHRGLLCCWRLDASLAAFARLLEPLEPVHLATDRLQA